MSQLVISYQADDPLAQSFQRQLTQWAGRHWDFPTLKFHNQRPNVAFETHQAARLRRQFKADLKASQRLLVMISRETWQGRLGN